MNKNDKPVRGIDWRAIFERHPELEPPGYYEAIARLKLKQEKTNDT